MRRMRWLMCGLAFSGLVQQACAADLGDSFLRGSNAITVPGSMRWDGFYVGGQVGAAYSGTDFGASSKSLVAFILRNTTIEDQFHVSDWTTLGKGDTSGFSYGGFAGYQAQWDGAVIGIEANYNRTNLSLAASDSMSRSFATSDGYDNNVRVIGSSSIHITDYGTLRVRGGWAIDCFMPYGFVGFAMGRADVSRTAQVIASGTSTTGGPPYSTNQTRTEANNGAFAYGYAAGFGVDYALMRNVFVRGEYEYVGFGAFNDLRTHIHTARLGAGVKF